MIVYQVINANNQLEFAFLSYAFAAKKVAKLNKHHGASYTIHAVQDEPL
jgi:hypothetical protein